MRRAHAVSRIFIILIAALGLAACNPGPDAELEAAFEAFCEAGEPYFDTDLHNEVRFRTDFWDLEGRTEIAPEAVSNPPDCAFSQTLISFPVDKIRPKFLLAMHDTGGVAFGRGYAGEHLFPDSFPALQALSADPDTLLIYELEENAPSCELTRDVVALTEKVVSHDPAASPSAYAEIITLLGDRQTTRRVLEQARLDLAQGRCIVARPPVDGDPIPSGGYWHCWAEQGQTDISLMTYDIRTDQVPIYRSHYAILWWKGLGPFGGGRRSCCLSNEHSCTIPPGVVSMGAAIQARYGDGTENE